MVVVPLSFAPDILYIPVFGSLCRENSLETTVVTLPLASSSSSFAAAVELPPWPNGLGYDWGVHLEDAIITHTQMGLMAEIIEMIKAKERETVAAADHQESAFALMTIGEASSSSIETISSSDEDFYSRECSKDNKVEGSVSKELINEPKINKNIVNNRDNCILIEPDVIESNDKLKKMLYGDFKTIKQKKETLANTLGKNFQENIDKHYTPKIQSTPLVVHQISSKSHQNKPSSSKTYESYKRIFKERRSCFHYGTFGHILVNCPYKNQEKWPIVQQQTVSLEVPLVKQLKIHSPVQYMVKSKHVARPSTVRWNRKPIVQSVSTSGSIQSSERHVAKLSRPQRRRRNKRLRKLEQQPVGNQLGKTITGLSIDTSKPAVQGK
ncbi:hypothetical protein L1987_32344 [Smallanthus sonchifolius]|uniref:Uncharacterized protein n=1 Tax=Smallanthus sonchifolius TaxID=185202 RepID=A0ACB9I8T9_9ASTR|nr:hypothetical protein L1987_32344 [Smallanthus sonchifolius]